MPIVEEAMHMGILRFADAQETAVSHNIQKARRTVYSLMGSGLHGESGLDPETSIHLLQTYVLSILVYGLEVVIPKAALVEKMERTYKQFINKFYHYRPQWPTQQCISYREPCLWKMLSLARTLPYLELIIS